MSSSSQSPWQWVVQFGTSAVCQGPPCGKDLPGGQGWRWRWWWWSSWWLLWWRLEVKGPVGPRLLVGGPSGLLDFVLGDEENHYHGHHDGDNDYTKLTMMIITNTKREYTSSQQCTAIFPWETLSIFMWFGFKPMVDETRDINSKNVLKRICLGALSCDRKKEISHGARQNCINVSCNRLKTISVLKSAQTGHRKNSQIIP